ncbi:Inositol-1-monophosphatase [Seminavis robusta]|uniref:Inositol-1-monophosphatase n=1 Tax=Seminavis robusta TaxID=568900 RepID=A0A9N8E8U3_9STRA|nr:Inositol-1-monophosphatase [Seminavis robusta]|eukprot:Sro675_g185490.1 Inositol-1-monophosphatase (330) ;mRNA; f:27542-28837
MRQGSFVSTRWSVFAQVLALVFIFPLARAFVATTPRPSKNRARLAMASQLDDALLDQVLDVAIDASKKAGEIIIGNAGPTEVTERKANSRDLLTLIDPLCEKTIKETVLASFPDHDFLGEEDVPPGKEASAAAIASKLESASNSWLWVVDPIDGTTNFVHGMPLNCPSVAASFNGEVVVGVIFDPYRDELFTAVKGRGAQMNGEPISVGKQDCIGDAIVAMGSPPGEESMQMSMKAVQVLMPKVRTLRMIGSAAIMLAWVANGRLTCYWEYDLSSWDIAAGALIIQEAGGKFTDLAGNDFSLQTRKIIGCAPAVHDEILRVLREEAGIV